MNFFEKELRKLFECSEIIDMPRFAGRICLARLTDKTNAKLEFVTLGTHGIYEGIKATVVNRDDGPIDQTVFRFIDILGKRETPGNPNFKDGIYPHIWHDGKQYEWYAYKPTPGDMDKITKAIDDYLELFCDPVQTHGMTQQMV
jgi:hypothetical protein